MKTLLTFTILALSALIIHGADESDAVMPKAITKAEINATELGRPIPLASHLVIPKIMKALKGTPTFDDLSKILGDPHMDIGSGLYVFVYTLDEGGSIIVGTSDKKAVLYVDRGVDRLYPIRTTSLRLEADLEINYPLSITEIKLVKANSLALKIENKSKETITIPLESGFPDYSSNSNCLLLRIRKSNSAKVDYFGVKPMQTTLVIPSLSSALVIVQAAKQSFGLHKNDEIEVAIDNTSVAVGFEGIKNNAIHHGLILSEKVKLLDGLD